MRRSVGFVLACLLVPILCAACGRSSAADNTEICQDLVNLQATVDFLAAPGPAATVGEVRGALDKLDPTLQAVHEDDAVPDAEDNALLDAQKAYRDQIENLGDDTPFAPTAAATASIAQGLLHGYDVVRQELACPASLEPG
jgi:hypothetical protein